jgi:hypothetical protein
MELDSGYVELQTDPKSKQISQNGEQKRACTHLQRGELKRLALALA